ncbi:hypothetical protein IscW_ISCW021205 [Ixodes scapularis]|uniref:Uncharacterized protein n=1 Tax=Ixodes scapularis TaxID=6945 RepID=B7Q5L5_IXOSC|nr:hypothetical protein IscW_ISCW021205 [Ixodes scapularis]|eukprot:XP_002402022.1 hypothetical protein IscW_ISCW021205 [Ixodes scapularis]
MKIRQKLDAARRSGCGGKDVRRPYWCHYSLLDSMLEDTSPAGKRRSCEPPDIDPLARSVKDALERCSAALSGLPDRPGHERDDYCDIEATWIASKLKIFPRSHRCRVAHKIHCIIHEEEMKLYE